MSVLRPTATVLGAHTPGSAPGSTIMSVLRPTAMVLGAENECASTYSDVLGAHTPESAPGSTIISVLRPTAMVLGAKTECASTYSDGFGCSHSRICSRIGESSAPGTTIMRVLACSRIDHNEDSGLPP